MSLVTYFKYEEKKEMTQIQQFEQTLKTMRIMVSNNAVLGINWRAVQGVGDDISEYFMRFWQSNPKNLTEKENYESGRWYELLQELSIIFHKNAPDFGRSYTDEYWFEM